jgi:hypothetical protein
MSGALRPPSEKFSDKEAKSIRERVTSLEDLLGEPPTMEEVADCYMEAVEEVLGAELVPSGLTQLEEEAYREELAHGFSEEWIMAMSERRKFGPSIPQNVIRGEHIIKVPSGPLIRAVVLVEGQVLKNLSLTGSFHCTPVNVVEEMEEALRGSPLDHSVIKERVSSFFLRDKVQISSCSPEDFVETIMQAATNAINGRNF